MSRTRDRGTLPSDCLRVVVGLFVFAAGVHLTIFASIGVVEIGRWSTVTLAGWLLGGPGGLGTLVAALGAGAVMQVVYDLIGFDPRDVTHRGLNEL